MANIICHNKGRYNLYSTVSDRFCYVSSLDVNQLFHVIYEKYGNVGIDALPERLERAHKNGHSAITDETLEQLLCCNRAGVNEENLSYQECIDRFLS